jgi:hypothetical protein
MLLFFVLVLRRALWYAKGMKIQDRPLSHQHQPRPSNTSHTVHHPPAEPEWAWPRGWRPGAKDTTVNVPWLAANAMLVGLIALTVWWKTSNATAAAKTTRAVEQSSTTLEGPVISGSTRSSE